MNPAIQPLLEQLLTISVTLEQHVLEDLDFPDGWLQLVEQRQEVIDQLSACFQQGAVLTVDQKEQYIKKAYEIDQRILPVINRKKNEFASKISSLQKSKQVNKQYSGYSDYVPYGAFFDKKK